jgi:hypothetical protein
VERRWGAAQRSAELLNALLALPKLFQSLPPKLELGLAGCAWHVTVLLANCSIQLQQRFKPTPQLTAVPEQNPLAICTLTMKDKRMKDKRMKDKRMKDKRMKDKRMAGMGFVCPPCACP